MPDLETLRIGRRHTSGKECLPACLTLGALIKRIQAEPNPNERFAFLMPRTQGPCRLGVYNLLDQITLERLNWKHRVRIWSPAESGYFDATPPGWAMLVFAGFMASDLLQAALMEIRPDETDPGAAQSIYSRYMRDLSELLESEARKELSLAASIWQTASGHLFGLRRLLLRAVAELKSIRGCVPRPTVLVAGEIYVRCDPFANDSIVKKLEARGLRCRLAPLTEWLEYVEYLNTRLPQARLSKRLGKWLQDRVQQLMYSTMAQSLGWPRKMSIQQSLAAAAPYIREALAGEAVLTVGGALHEWRHGHIDAVLSIGPLECLPNKVAEAQFFHGAEQEGLLSLTISVNGDPVDPEIIDNFAFEVHARHRKKHPDYRVPPLFSGRMQSTPPDMPDVKTGSQRLLRA
ncbi:MAG: CoA activase, partial [Candidatus Omnitrophica bacterium]|nr:CoA activase [Candidatus Omnitrophota bacterium]